MTDSRFVLQKGQLSAEAQEMAKTELRETPDVVVEALAKLREMLKNDDKYYFRDDEEVLLIFLRPCKFYAESAFELMKRVANFKEQYASTIANVKPEDEIATLTQHNVVNVFADRDSKGRRVLVAHLGSHWNTKEVSGDSIFRVFYLIHVMAMQEPESQVRGVVVILDFENLGMKQIGQLTPGFSLRLLTFIQQAMPLRLKEVHIVKQPFIFNIVWKVFQPFIQEKLKGRIHFHGSKMESLHKFLGPEKLPANYGGKLPQMDYTSKQWYPVMEKQKEIIEEWNTWGKKKQ